MKEYKKLEKIGYSGITLRDLFDQFSSEFGSTDFEKKVAKIENLIAKGINIEILIYEYLKEYKKSSKPYVAKDISWALSSLIEYRIGKKIGASFKNSKEILIPIFLRRNSMLGIFTQVDIGGGSWKAIHAKITSGWAYDFDLIEKKSDNVFVELLIEKAWGRKFATRLEYAFYTAKFKQAFNETIHVGGVSALWSL